MALGFVLIGIITGLVAGFAVWYLGAGLGLAFLAYMGGGSFGLGLAVLLTFGGALAGQDAADQGTTRQPHS